MQVCTRHKYSRSIRNACAHLRLSWRMVQGIQGERPATPASLVLVVVVVVLLLVLLPPLLLLLLLPPLLLLAVLLLAGVLQNVVVVSAAEWFADASTQGSRSIWNARAHLQLSWRVLMG